jgi:hypothetical protein
MQPKANSHLGNKSNQDQGIQNDNNPFDIFY